MSNLSNLISEVLSDDNIELEKDLLREFIPKGPNETMEEFSVRLKKMMNSLLLDAAIDDTHREKLRMLLNGYQTEPEKEKLTPFVIFDEPINYLKYSTIPASEEDQKKELAKSLEKFGDAMKNLGDK